MLTLREKSRALEGKLRELVQFGEENDSISERVHRITLALLAARDLPLLLDALYRNLREDFAVPAVALRLWMDTPAQDRIEFGRHQSGGARVCREPRRPLFQRTPHVRHAEPGSRAPARRVRSLVYVPLRIERPVGLLVLGSDDPQRFSADKGTLYLTRLGEAREHGAEALRR